MISKELLSEVLDIDDTESIYQIKLYENTISFNHISNCRSKQQTTEINIYELAHKCKEWAKNQGYVIGVDLDKVNIWSIKERRVVNHFEVYWEDYLEFEFKACEWVLKYRKDK